MTLIDFHTHNPKAEKNVFHVTNFDYFKAPSLSKPKGSYTIGLHPWWIEKAGSNWPEELIKIYSDFYCVGIGEIGLDRKCMVDFEKQKKVFAIQLEIAKKLKSPFIVIHCVRAYNDIIEHLKESSFEGNIVFHDFAGNEEELKALMKFRCFFSLGWRLYKSEKVQEMIKKIPVGKLFLETDDQLDYSIFEIYHRASELLNIEQEKLAKELVQNYEILCQ